ncbi:MAG TPA: protease inhibitor I42 family protein [Ktedonobacteraceae bacterium]|nr:protease inhibitor I42 family protein [Ktedonobacteraceae bacterium]HYA99263.1 protease inhibitor I42 family protein [Ktedonobacteraceae bacterium]
MLHIDENFNEREIELHVGEEFELCLPENPTTGFRWRLITNGEPACILHSTFFESPNGTPGRGGLHYWRFQAAQVGLGNIDLVYQRLSERESASSRRFTLQVRIHK